MEIIPEGLGWLSEQKRRAARAIAEALAGQDQTSIFNRLGLGALGDPAVTGAIGRSVARLPSTLVGGFADTADLGIKALDWLGGGKSGLTTAKPIGGSQHLAELIQKVVAGYPTEPGSTAADALFSAFAPGGAMKAGRGLFRAEQAAPEVLEALAQNASTGPAAGSRAAQRGILRLGGREDLIPSHGTKDIDLLRPEGLKRELSHPSIAFERNRLANPFIDPVGLIPRIGAFDPEYSANQSTVFPRDAYVGRSRDYPGHGKFEPTPELAQLRLKARELGAKVDTEGHRAEWWDKDWEPLASSIIDAHTASKRLAPHFRSYKEYEKSPRGAGVLKEDRAAYEEASAEHREIFDTRLYQWATQQPDYRRGDPIRIEQMLRDAARSGDPEARDLVQMARTVPASYAEMKVSGPVPLTGDRWAGALIMDPDPRHAQLARLLEARGIPVEKGYRSGTLEDYYAGRFGQATKMQLEAGPVKEQPAAFSLAENRRVLPAKIEANTYESMKAREVPEPAPSLYGVEEEAWSPPPSSATTVTDTKIVASSSVNDTAQGLLITLKPGEGKTFLGPGGHKWQIDHSGDLFVFGSNGKQFSGNILITPKGKISVETLAAGKKPAKQAGGKSPFTGDLVHDYEAGGFTPKQFEDQLANKAMNGGTITEAEQALFKDLKLETSDYYNNPSFLNKADAAYSKAQKAAKDSVGSFYDKNEIYLVQPNGVIEHWATFGMKTPVGHLFEDIPQ